ncbi:MAG TPA: lysophospholipid acyltransferase family protein [Acidimicrobiales bacterium]|nr:lysophospholipid acyltransferase family protein [Acidimicrobiales bacterium]
MRAYAVVRFLIWLVAKILWRISFEGLQNIPRSGPFVLAPIHRSFIDFGLVSAVTRRPMGFMGKESLWKNRYFGAFITHLGAYPVNRGAPDRESLRRTLELLADGKPLVLFPEGTRRSGPVIENLHEGAAYVAAKAGVPLIPVGIGGSERALPKGKALPRLVRIHVLVGEPMIPPPIAEGARHPSRRAIKDFTVHLQVVLQDLFDRAQRTAGVDVPVNQSPPPDV